MKRIRIRKASHDWILMCPCGWVAHRDNWFEINWLANYHAEIHWTYEEE